MAEEDCIRTEFNAKKGRLLYINSKTGNKGWSREEVMEAATTGSPAVKQVVPSNMSSDREITRGYLEKFHLEREDEATAAAESTGHEPRTDKERKIVEACLLVFVQGIEVCETTLDKQLIRVSLAGFQNHSTRGD